MEHFIASSPTINNSRPIKLKNLLNCEQTVDILHTKYKNNNKSHHCNEIRCLGSLMNPKPLEHRVRSPAELLEQAQDFINNFYSSIKRLDSPAHKQRLKEIEEQIRTNETYYLKETELIYGAKLAWRNAPRCIGRIQWSKLQVFDARFTKNANEMFEALCNHIKYATNKGSLRSAITIFPPRVKSTDMDWRIWNNQLISYAGYRDKDTGKITGDPLNVDFTEICLKLGWKSKRTRFDVLPLVLSANGGPPQMFPLPDDLVLRVKIKHPKYKWFEEMQLEWYALPAVANMMLDVGGLQFTAAPFSGWYMVTEIGTRDLGDTNRYNVLEEVAQRLGLNTKSNMSLWKDQAVVELNIAVLDSFQSAGVTIVDHHTASETFMTHLANEQRLRGGCPADWVWLVPPTAGSTTQVFHQEMVNYHLLPNYEYMDAPYKNYDWLKWEKAREMSHKLADDKLASVMAGEGSPLRKVLSSGLVAGAGVSSANGGANTTPMIGSSTLLSSSLSASSTPQRKTSFELASSPGSVNSNGDLTPRRLRFKEIARAVKFTSKLFGKALSRRIKATILFATETGKSERFANKLAQTFSCAFNVHLMSMSDYDMTCLEHEALLLIVTSTFGNGDPPENGEAFAKHLAAVKLTGDTSPDIDSINSVSTNPFFQMLSEDKAADDQKSSAGGGDKLSSLGSVGSDSTKSTSSSSSSYSSSSSSSSSTVPTIMTTDKPTTNGTTINGTSSATNVDSGNETGDDDRRQELLKKQMQEQQTNIRPLSNVRFSVFALGSTAYPHFCAFGRYVDQTLGELGAERIVKCACGDELAGQEKAFNEWSSEVFKIACDVFCLTDSIGPIDGRPEILWSPRDVRFAPIQLIGNSKDSMQLSSSTSSVVSQAKRKLFDSNGTSSSLDRSVGKATLGAPDASVLSSKKTVVQNLMGITGKKIVPFTVVNRLDLHTFSPEENLQTLRLDLESDLVAGPYSDYLNSRTATQRHSIKHQQSMPANLANGLPQAQQQPQPPRAPIMFEPGDHVGIYPTNKLEMVEKILIRMDEDLKKVTTTTTNGDEPNNNNISSQQQQTISARPTIDFDQCYRILVRREQMDLTPASSSPASNGGTPNGSESNNNEQDNWIPYDRLPITSIREALTRYLDITNPPNQEFLSILARLSEDLEEKKRLQLMARNFSVYEEWKNKTVPTLLSVLEQFKSVKFEPALITQIPLIKPRFYSVSGISVNLTLGVVRFKTSTGENREGLCSNYLNTVPLNSRINYVYGYIRSAPTFHMPQDKSVPMILISAGTGIAPFRSFWQKRYADMYLKKNTQQQQQQKSDAINQVDSKSDKFGRIDLYFGCRNPKYLLYKDELDQMMETGVLSSINVAFSRQIDKKKTYVQDKLMENNQDICKLIMADGAHVYVCGDVAMADGVYKTLAKILTENNSKEDTANSGPVSLESTTSNTTTTTTSNRSSDDGETILMNLRNLNRYHEDIFGAKQAT